MIKKNLIYLSLAHLILWFIEMYIQITANHFQSIWFLTPVELLLFELEEHMSENLHALSKQTAQIWKNWQNELLICYN